MDCALVNLLHNPNTHSNRRRFTGHFCGQTPELNAALYSWLPSDTRTLATQKDALVLSREVRFKVMAVPLLASSLHAVS